MFKRVIESICTALAIGAISFIITAITQIGIADVGKVRIGQVYQTRENKYELNIELINFSKNYVNDLKIKIPSNININDLLFSDPLAITRIETTTNDYSLYSINQIEPNSRNTIIIPLSMKTDYISFTNLKEKKFALENTSLLRSPKEEILYIIFLSTIIYVVLLFIQTYIVLTQKFKSNQENYKTKWKI